MCEIGVGGMPVNGAGWGEDEASHGVGRASTGSGGRARGQKGEARGVLDNNEQLDFSISTAEFVANSDYEVAGFGK